MSEQQINQIALIEIEEQIDSMIEAAQYGYGDDIHYGNGL